MKTAGWVIGAVVVAAGVYYFASDPFRTKVDETVRQKTQWTPENIQKDPVGYLTWATGEMKKSEAGLEARDLELTAKSNAANRELESVTDKLNEYQALLDKLRAAYRAGTEANSWPQTVNGFALDELSLKRKVVETGKTIEQLTPYRQGLETHVSKIGKMVETIGANLSDVRDKQRQLSLNLSIAKAQEAYKIPVDIADNVNAVMDMSLAILKQSRQEDGPSIEDMMEKTSSEKLEDDFSKYMGG